MKTTNPLWQAGLRVGVISHPAAHIVMRDLPDEALLTLTAPVTLIKNPFGLDQSKWDPTNYPSVSPKPIMVYLRTSYGAGYKDPMWATHVNGWSDQNVPLTGYHFYLYNEAWRGQVDIVKSQLALVGGVSVLSFPFVLDIEGNPNMSASTAQGLLWNWINAINQELGIGVDIYSSANYLNYLRVAGKLPNWCTYPDAVTGQPRKFYIAGYPTYPNDFAVMPDSYWPSGLDRSKQFRAWQYADDVAVTGIQGAQDGNQVNDVTSVPPPTTTRSAVVTATAGLNVRSGPGSTYPVVGALSYNTVVKVDQSSAGWAHIVTPVPPAPGWCSETYLRYS